VIDGARTVGEWLVAAGAAGLLGAVVELRLHLGARRPDPRDTTEGERQC